MKGLVGETQHSRSQVLKQRADSQDVESTSVSTGHAFTWFIDPDASRTVKIQKAFGEVEDADQVSIRRSSQLPFTDI